MHSTQSYRCVDATYCNWQIRAPACNIRWVTRSRTTWSVWSSRVTDARDCKKLLCAASNMEALATPANGSVDYFAADKRPVILFDGACNMCNGGVNFVLDWDKTGVYRFAALQSAPGRQLLLRCGRRPDDISSIVLVEENDCYIKSDAVLRIATKLGMPWPLLAGLASLTPKFIRDPVYDQVAANRYLVFGKTNSCRVTDDGFTERFLGA